MPTAVKAEELDLETYWCFSTNSRIYPPLMLNLPFIQFLDRAEMFKNKIFFFSEGYTYDQQMGAFRDYIRLCYSRERIVKFLPKGIRPTFKNWKPPWLTDYQMPQKLRNKFTFLKTNADDYITVQYCSSHHWRKTWVVKTNATPTKIIPYNELKTQIERINPKIVKFIGNISDGLIVDPIIEQLQKEFPSSKFFNNCGCLLEETFSLLYNSKLHICCESFSGVFTSLLAIETHMYCSGEDLLDRYKIRGLKFYPRNATL